MLNIAGEWIWNLEKTEKTYLYGSCDVEGHVAKDNRQYVVDLARVFPPSTPRMDTKSDFLIYLLRPELVKSNPVPLCPDSFSG
jgi:hypothetical protein